MKKWIERNYDILANILSAILSVTLSLLANGVYDFLKTDDPTAINSYVVWTLIGVVLALIVGISIALKKVKNYLFKEDDLNKYIQKAYLSIQDLSLESQSFLQEDDSGALNKWFLRNMQLAVEKCYDFLWSSFGSGKILIEETKFEVTYMTLSYEDSKITIPCSCNREKRTPNSMLMRKDNPSIYDNTVTALIYREYREHRKPTFRIIEDTAKSAQNADEYQFIYENQNERIKSTVVLPVLSHKNELLGTLVVHCNRPGFFQESQRAFWEEILQLFASEIGKNKILLDSVVEKGSEPF